MSAKRGLLALSLVLIVLLVLSTTTVAVAYVDRGGGAPYVTPYAPYSYWAGEVVSEPRPYAPYTAGPVLHEGEKVPERIGNYLLR